MFTSNNTPASEFQQARALNAIINLDAYEQLDFLASVAPLPDLLCFRFNPGDLKQGNAIIGDPQQAKFGMTEAQVLAGLRDARAMGVSRFGLHTMVASNELDVNYFIETAALLFDLVLLVERELGIRFEFVNLGGGLGIPYRPNQTPINLTQLSEGIRAAYVQRNLNPLKLFMECGRFITGPHGYLVSRVRHIKRTTKTFAGLDASMSDLMRPGMYGAYHHLSVLDKIAMPPSYLYDVTGSLCENNDKFAIDRALPELAAGDIVVIHDAGAHGHAMGFNYNGKLRSAEFLLRRDQTPVQIRRAERLDDYFATLDFSAIQPLS